MLRLSVCMDQGKGLCESERRNTHTHIYIHWLFEIPIHCYQALSHVLACASVHHSHCAWRSSQHFRQTALGLVWSGSMRLLDCLLHIYLFCRGDIFPYKIEANWSLLQAALLSLGDEPCMFIVPGS